MPFLSSVPFCMKIIDRYIGKSTLIATVFAVAVLSFVLVLGNIFKELLDLLVERNVPVQTVLAFMMFVLPFSLAFTIPWGLLTALLLIFGRLSADNELIALRANGISIPRVSLPIFCIAAILTAICFWINIDIAPRAEKKMLLSIFEIATNNPSALFGADEVVNEFPDRRVYVGDRKGDTLINVIVIEIDRDNNPIKMVHAERGNLIADPAHSRLLLKLYNAQFEERDPKDPRNIKKIRQGINLIEGTFPIPLQALYAEYMNTGRVTSYTMAELKKEELTTPNPKRALRVRVEISRRFSISFACLAFTLIAIPLGITAHRKETSVGFALSLALAFIYFFFILVARSLQENAQAHPVFLMWVPNILFITLGIFLFFRMARR